MQSSTQEMKGGESETQGNSQVHSKLKVSLDYMNLNKKKALHIRKIKHKGLQRMLSG